jgi:outer membrane phospholipase A
MFFLRTSPKRSIASFYGLCERPKVFAKPREPEYSALMRSNGICWWILPTIAITLAAVAAIASGQTTLLVPPAEPATAGGDATLFVYHLNDGAAPLRVDPAASLAARASYAGREVDVTLTRADAQAGPLDVKPGAFARVPYRLVVPADAAGHQVMIQLPGAAPAVLRVGPSATTEPLATSTTPAVREPTLTAPVVGGAETEPAAPYAGDARGHTAREGLTEYFAGHFSAYEPVYFLVGPERPNGKFQISLKYQIFNPAESVAQAVPALAGLHVAYSQTSFWDLEGDSKPFFDNSYRPELLLSYPDLMPGPADQDDIGILRQLGLQIGLQHESNGRAGEASRSTNYVYVRPIFTFGDPAGDQRGLFMTVAPRVHAYVGDLSDNPDIKEFRGYGDLRLVFGQRDGLQLAAIGRIGSHADKGSVELDLTYPLRALLGRNVDMFLHAQFFTGYGESLLLYNDSDNTFRLGVSLIR